VPLLRLLDRTVHFTVSNHLLSAQRNNTRLLLRFHERTIGAEERTLTQAFIHLICFAFVEAKDFRDIGGERDLGGFLHYLNACDFVRNAKGTSFLSN
jgi:hypothetical protein